MLDAFEDEVAARIEANMRNTELHARADDFLQVSIPEKYSYNFSWLGRPIIQYPQDIVALQELIAAIRPHVIIETGIAHGGSLIFSASMLELNAVCGGPPDAKVIGVDIDIRAHNRVKIEAHPLYKRITMIEGSSIAPDVIARVKSQVRPNDRVLVSLDSNHTHDHVLAELLAYAPLTSVGSYCVVFDTLIENLPEDSFPDRPWGRGNNPRTAVTEFLSSHPEFEIDTRITHKLQITASPDGYLKRVR